MTKSSNFLQRSVLLNLLFAIEGGAMFVLDIALAAALGLGARSDSLYAAWSLPLTIGRGAFQSLTNSLISLYAETDDDNTAYSHAATVIGLLAFTLALLMSLTSRWWFPWSVPGAAAETRLESASLAAILSWLVVLLALAETQRAFFYRLGRNSFPSAARVLGALASIIFILFSAKEQNLRLVAFGLVAGAGVEMILGFVGLMTLGLRLRLAWPPADRLRRMTHVVGLPLLGQIVLIGASTAERAVASFLGPGALTAVTYAGRIFQMMERFIFRGFVISTIQAYVAGMAGSWRRDTRLLLLLAVPMMVIFAVLPAPLIAVAFERGRFTAESTQLVATALRFYAFAIPIVAFNRIPYALAFAKSKSRDLLIYSLIYATVLIGSEILLISAGITLPVFGIAYILAVTAGTYWLYTRVMSPGDVPAWTSGEVLRLLGVTLITFAGTTLIVYLVARWTNELAMSDWITLLVGAGGCLALTVGGAWLFRLPEISRVAYLLQRANR